MPNIAVQSSKNMPNRCRLSRLLKRKRFPFLETLESRILLDAIVVTWVGTPGGFGGDGVNWSDANNWAVAGDRIASPPNNTANTVYIVKISYLTTAITLDQQVTISGLQVTGTGIDLNNHALTVTNAPDPHQTPGTKDPNAALLGVANFTGTNTFIDNQAANAPLGTLTAKQLTVSTGPFAIGSGTEFHSTGNFTMAPSGTTYVQGGGKLVVDGDAMLHGLPSGSQGSHLLLSGDAAGETNNGKAATVSIGGNLKVGGNGWASVWLDDASTLTVGKDATITSTNKNSSLTTTNGSNVTIAGKLNVIGGLDNAPVASSVAANLTASGNSTITAASLSTGLSGSSHASTANITISGSRLILTDPTATSTLGPTSFGSSIVNVDKDGSISSNGSIHTANAKISGGGLIHAQVSTGDPPEIAPGDYFAFNHDTTLTRNAAPIDAFGSLTVNGNLDASEGMTLDEVFGEGSGESGNGTSQNSMLAVTGNVTLGANCELRVGLANGEDPVTLVSAYRAGDTFSVLTGSSITGTFINLPAGTYLGTGLLPTLQDGLTWTVAYTQTSVTVTVTAPIEKNVVVWSGNDDVSPQSFSDPGNWVGGVVPGPNDIVEFSGLGLAQLDSSVELGGLSNYLKTPQMTDTIHWQEANERSQGWPEASERSKRWTRFGNVRMTFGTT